MKNKKNQITIRIIKEGFVSSNKIKTKNQNITDNISKKKVEKITQKQTKPVK